MTTSRVLVSLLTDDQEFQRLQASEAEAAAKRSGMEIDIVFARNNGSLQREQIYKHIHGLHATRPSAIIVQTVSPDGLPGAARDAAKAGIGWVLLNRDLSYLAELRKEHAELPIGIVTIGQLEIGHIQARQLRKLLPKGGNVLYLQGPAESTAAEQRLQGAQQGLGDEFHLKIVNGEWTEASAEKATASWLRLSSSRELSVDAIVAQNDAMAIGARKAIAATMPQWLNRPFLGCDGLTESGQKLVREKTLAATVVVQPTAGVAVDLLANHLRSKGAFPAKTVLTPSQYQA